MHSQVTSTVCSEAFGTIGCLVVHNLVHGRSFGGVRLVPDINLEEMQASARAMAYKHAFIGFPMGGAKAAVKIDEHRERQKKDILFEFGRALAPFITTGAYVPGIDMNCTLDDLRSIFQGAGVRRDLSGWKNLSHVYTAWSCFVSTQVALEALGIGLPNVTFAVQGFGKVGSEYARLISRAGAKLIAVSNRTGAIANENGFDVDDLLRKRQDGGDGFIPCYSKGERLSHQQVLAAPVTVLLPAARAWAIDENNYRDIQAEIIICAANVAMDDGVERRLFEKGKMAITDFVAACGGIFGSVLEHELTQEKIWDLLNTVYRKKISRMLSLSLETGQPICALARKEVEDRMASWDESRRPWPRLGWELWKKAPDALRVRRYFRFYEKLWATG